MSDEIVLTWSCECDGDRVLESTFGVERLTTEQLDEADDMLPSPAGVPDMLVDVRTCCECGAACLEDIESLDYAPDGYEVSCVHVLPLHDGWTDDETIRWVSQRLTLPDKEPEQGWLTITMFNGCEICDEREHETD